MSRYLHTFSRFWWLLLIPILILPAAEFQNVRHSGTGYVASTNIYVQQTAASNSTVNPTAWLSLAQIESANITQWLQSPTFCLDVARSSPIYSKQLGLMADPKQTVSSDLQQHVTVTARGDNLVSIAYSSQNPTLAIQVVQGVLTNATSSTQASSSRVAAVNKAYYQSLLITAQANERKSADQLTSYMSQHGVTVPDLQTQMVSDTTLATLYDQHKSDQQTVSDLQQKIKAAVAQNSLPATVVNQNGYYIADPPTVAYISANKKKELLSVAIALVLGLLLAGAFLVVMTAVDRTFRAPADVPVLLDLPVLAVVPYSAGLKDKASRKQPEPAPILNTPSRPRAS
ncbi:MAG: hypothetical protein JWO59_403 [Chloroflexi bacterium]|jgi:capsular polysaccharide biosynthesis protein|nr:hypothetical protein [Chloroflexota bacterium]MDB5076951.1 hypothetical protein [Chloroflexota bacterium]